MSMPYRMRGITDDRYAKMSDYDKRIVDDFACPTCLQPAGAICFRKHSIELRNPYNWLQRPHHARRLLRRQPNGQSDFTA